MARSKVETELPSEIKDELDARLVQSSFGEYRALAAWLGEQGYAISKSSVQRYGSQLEKSIARIKASTQMAQILAREAGDDEGAMIDATLRLAQQKFFELLMDLEIDPEDIDPLKLMRALSDLSKASTTQKKLMQQIRKDAQEKLATLEKQAKGMDPMEVIAWVKENVYGIYDKPVEPGAAGAAS